MNTAAIGNPSIITELASKYGSSTIAISIEAIKDGGQYFAYTDNGREYTGVEVFSWAKKVEALGAGEIIITSVDNEGTGNGFDTELVCGIYNTVTIPVIAHGGAGPIPNIDEMVNNCKVSGISIASMFHYDLIKKASIADVGTTGEGNIDFLKSGQAFSKFNTMNIKELKKSLSSNGIECRTVG